MRLMFIDPPKRSPRSAQTLVLLASAWLAVLGNIALWRNLIQLPDLTGWQGVVFGAAFALIIASVLTALLALLAWRWTLKPAISFLLLCAGFSTHYMLSFGILVDTPMLVNVLHTDSREVGEQLSVGLALTVAALAGLPMVWLWRQAWASKRWGQQALHNAGLCLVGLLVAVGTTLAVFQDFASLMRNHTQLRYQINPLNSVYAMLDLTLIPSELRGGPLHALGEDAHIDTRASKDADVQHPPLLVLVLGETARSQNFSLNGYPRLTNPMLAQENVVSFSQVTSCSTRTADSLPCMFSHLGREGFAQRLHESENLLDVLQRAGYAVLWIDNQSGCKGQCERVANVNTALIKVAGECEDGECRDTVMLTRIDEELAKLPAKQRARGTVVVMHQMGSHGPAYYKRTPAAFKKFQPECQENSLSHCERQQVVNAYDNTIVFTDYFLSRLIGWLKAQEKNSTPAMLYVSDHGESLGENNLYLHGLPYALAPDVQKHVAMISWMSPSFERWSDVSTTCLRQQRDRALSHDHLFHSVLGVMAVQTRVYQAQNDLFVTCKGH